MEFPITISFDTNIFDSYQYNIDEGSDLFTLIQYVQEGYIKVVLSNVVIAEMKSHCVEKANKILDNIQSCQAISKQLKLSYVPSTVDKESLKNEAESFITEFLDTLNVTVMDYSNLSIEDLFINYFSKNPPFEERKKSEFPDAVIVMQIKQRFGKNNPLYFITHDDGVKRALKAEEYCTVFSSISDVFDLISKARSEYNNIQKTITELFPSIIAEITKRLQNEDCISLAGQSQDAYGNIFGYEYKDVKYYNQNVDGISIFTIDYFDEKAIASRLKCTVSIDAECSYDNHNNYGSGINIEKHKANFAVSVIINREQKNIEALKFHVFLGGDSRLERYPKYEHSKPYTTCPECGTDLSIENDGGNGFCINCAPNH